MPIALHQLIPANAGQATYATARTLALATISQFAAVRGVGVGIGPASCCAAVAVVPNGGAGFPALAGQVFSVVFGNSRLAPAGLVWEIVGGHAERAALTAAGANGLALYGPGANTAVLYVELSPCGGCANWLNGGGGGVANPFNGVINGAGLVTLDVWYTWAYPAGVPAMIGFHGQPEAWQLANI